MNLVSFSDLVLRLNFSKRIDSCLYLICEKYYTLSSSAITGETISVIAGFELSTGQQNMMI